MGLVSFNSERERERESESESESEREREKARGAYHVFSIDRDLEVSSGGRGGKGRSCAVRSRSLPTCDVNLESRRHLKTHAMA